MFRLSKFFKNNKLIVIFCSLILFISLIGLSIRSHHQSPVEQYVGDTVSVPQRVLSYPLHIVTGSIDGLFNGKTSKEDKNKIKQLEAENERLKAENEGFRKELDIKDISKYEPLSATVIARNPDQWMNKAIIDKGKKAGIKQNQAVITAEGLVGSVVKVNQFSAQVDLLSTSSRNGKLSVNIQHDSKNIFGLINHYDRKTNELVISDIDNKDKIAKGDKVVTSGLANQIPSNLYIGEVTKVENDQYGLSKEVRVKTAADLSDLDHVYVAQRDPKTLPDESGDE